MSDSPARQQTTEQRLQARLAELRTQRRATIFEALRQYRLARRWTLVASCGAGLLIGSSLVQLVLGALLLGALGIIVGVLVVLYCRQQRRRLQEAQREAYVLLEGMS